LKILYAIQGTGNGHLARARDVYPELAKYGATDVLVSGIQADIELPFPVKYKLYGLSFIFGQHGSVDKWATFKKLRPFTLINDITRLRVQDYDLIINDFEPVSAWACRLHKKHCVSLSHQSAVLHPMAPRPAAYDWLGNMILKHYAPHSSAYSFHFQSFDQNIFTPVVRKEIRKIAISDEGHYTVYLPAYNDETIVKELSVYENINWQVFSKHSHEAFTFKNIHVQPIENDAFISSMASSTGVLCGAGFETPAEALFMGKKLMVIPMHGQYEQQCNAALLASMDIPVIKSLSRKYKNKISGWLMQEEGITVNYPDNIRSVVAKVMEDYLALQLTVNPSMPQLG
jgi:uncharacterized protein (TIGR00661 family)